MLELLIIYMLIGLVTPTILQLIAVKIIKEDEFKVSEIFDVYTCKKFIFIHIVFMIIWIFIIIVFMIAYLTRFYEGSKLQHHCQKIVEFWESGFEKGENK